MNNNQETTRTTLRLPARVKMWVHEKATEKGISENAQINLTLQKEMAAETEIGVLSSAASNRTISKEC